MNVCVFSNGYEVDSLKIYPEELSKEQVLQILNDFKKTNEIKYNKEHYYTFNHPANFL